MAEFSWHEAHTPRTLDLAAVTALVRVLATRPRLGLQQMQPVVTFELWLSKDRVRWLVGCDQQIARHLPGELAAQVGGLSFTTAHSTPRCRPVTAREVRISSSAYPLRLDTAGAVPSQPGCCSSAAVWARMNRSWCSG
jgi:hypothetical protein